LISPKVSASTLQASTQAGTSSCRSRSMQPSHFTATVLPAEVAVVAKASASNGQTIAHIAQPMQAASSMSTWSCSGSRKIAAVGHTWRHGAGSQCRHRLG
jgi:hypothetical protein